MSLTELIPGTKWDGTKTYFENLLSHVTQKGALQNVPLAVIANALNVYIAGSDLPWDQHLTTGGLLYTLGVVPTEKNVTCCAQKLMSITQALLEKKYENKTSKEKVQVLKIDDIKDESISLEIFGTEPVEMDRIDKWWNSFIRPDGKWMVFPTSDLKPMQVGVQLVAKATNHKVPKRYFSWIQMVAEGIAFDDITYVEKPGVATGHVIVTKEVTLPKDMLTFYVEDLMNKFDKYANTISTVLESKKLTKTEQKAQTMGRFAGAFRAMKAAQTSRKNRKAPKPQSAKTNTGLHGTGKTNPRTRAQGGRFSGKKKTSMMRAITTMEASIQTANKAPSRQTRETASKRTMDTTKLISTMLFVTNDRMEKMKKGDYSVFTDELKALWIRVADENDLYGDSKNAVNSIPVADAMCCTQWPWLMTLSGIAHTVECLNYVAKRTGNWVVSHVTAMSGREQGLRVAGALCSQALAPSVLRLMIGDETGDSGFYPGWNCPYATFSHLTNAEEGMVCHLIKNEERPPIIRVPKILTKRARSDTSIMCVGSSLIGLSGTFAVLASKKQDNQPANLEERVTEITTQVVRTARGGYVNIVDGNIRDDEGIYTPKMSNPQHLGDWTLIEVSSDGYKYVGYDFSLETMDELEAYQRTGKEGEKITGTVWPDALVKSIVNPGPPYGTGPIDLQLIAFDIWQIINERPQIGKSGLLSKSKSGRETKEFNFYTGRLETEIPKMRRPRPGDQMRVAKIKLVKPELKGSAMANLQSEDKPTRKAAQLKVIEQKMRAELKEKKKRRAAQLKKEKAAKGLPMTMDVSSEEEEEEMNEEPVIQTYYPSVHAAPVSSFGRPGTSGLHK